MRPDGRALDDLVTFTRIEMEAGDIEPWAAVLTQLRGTVFSSEEALWAVKLYNAYDDFGAAFRAMDRWPGPDAWRDSSSCSAAATWMPGRERRNLRGGKIIQHLNSYVAALGGQTQRQWLSEPLLSVTDTFGNFRALMSWMQRSVWGVGRLTAFEWAEFTAKVERLPVETPDGALWESSGPRESLCRLYRNPDPDPAWLHEAALTCRAMLADAGLALSWWDFETVICDFNVMRKGRYYPGQHLAMIREEIAGLPAGWQTVLVPALKAVVPAPWCETPPGVDRELARTYAATGRIPQPAWSTA